MFKLLKKIIFIISFLNYNLANGQSELTSQELNSTQANNETTNTFEEASTTDSFEFTTTTTFAGILIFPNLDQNTTSLENYNLSDQLTSLNTETTQNLVDHNTTTILTNETSTETTLLTNSESISIESTSTLIQTNLSDITSSSAETTSFIETTSKTLTLTSNPVKTSTRDPRFCQEGYVGKYCDGKYCLFF
jgi:hypothetical protein